MVQAGEDRQCFVLPFLVLCSLISSLLSLCAISVENSESC